MTPHAIVSYDDTPNDHDALMLGRTLRDAGARLTLAYVRHAVASLPGRRGALPPRGARAAGARRRLAPGARHPAPRRRERLDGRGPGAGSPQPEQADMIVFGSEYRTRRGHVSIGRSAQTPARGRPQRALALAPADYAVAGEPRDPRRRRPARHRRRGRDRDRLLHRRPARRHGRRPRPRRRPARRRLAPRGPRRPRDAQPRTRPTRSRRRPRPVLIVARGVPVHFETLVTA